MTMASFKRKNHTLNSKAVNGSGPDSSQHQTSAKPALWKIDCKPFTLPQKTRWTASEEQYSKLSFNLYMCPGMHTSSPHRHKRTQAQLKRRKLFRSEESPTSYSIHLIIVLERFSWYPLHQTIKKPSQHSHFFFSSFGRGKEGNRQTQTERTKKSNFALDLR